MNITSLFGYDGIDEPYVVNQRLFANLGHMLITTICPSCFGSYCYLCNVVDGVILSSETRCPHCGNTIVTNKIWVSKWLEHLTQV